MISKKPPKKEYVLPEKMHFAKDAILSLHHAAEDYMVTLFDDACLCALNSRRDMVMPKDLKLARIVWGEIPIELQLHHIDLVEEERLALQSLGRDLAPEDRAKKNDADENENESEEEAEDDKSESESESEVEMGSDEESD